MTNRQLITPHFLLHFFHLLFITQYDLHLNISFILSRVKMTERDALAVIGKPNCANRLLAIFYFIYLTSLFYILSYKSNKNNSEN